MKTTLILCCAALLGACANTPKYGETVPLAHSIDQAQQSADKIDGNITRARTAAERSDGKTLLIRRWLNAQP